MSERSRLSLIVIQIFLFSLMIALAGRLFYLQVAAEPKYKTAALEIQSRNIVTPAIRGMILDSSGKPLAVNQVGLVITVDRSKIDGLEDKGESVLRKLAKTLEVDYPSLYGKTRLCGEKIAPELTGKARCWNGSRYQPIPVTLTATEDIALQIAEHSEIYFGVEASPQGFRFYPAPDGSNSAHVLGYVGPVSEKDLLKERDRPLFVNEVLGKAKTIVVDRREAATSVLKENPPISGDHLVTSIDAKLQAVVEEQLLAAIARARAGSVDKKGARKADSGAAIVMDVKTGRILAMASYPTYDPNIWENGISQQQATDLYSDAKSVPALSRALQGTFAPASTFKVVSVVAADRAGYDLNGTYDCPAQFKVGNRIFKNYESKGVGLVKLQQGIAISCDTLWYKIAFDEWLKDGGLKPKSGAKNYFYTAAKDFRIGEKTGIDLPSESSGRLADRQWRAAWYERNKNYFCNYQKRATKAQLTPYLIAIAKENCVDGDKVRAGDAVNFAIGQGDTTMTPLQMVQMYAALANGGTVWKPTVAWGVVTPTGKKVREITPEKIGKLPISKKTLTFLNKALRSVITDGTAKWRFDGMPVAISAKTGTGEVYGKNLDGSAKDTTSWLASYGPTEKPKYAVVMMVSQGGTGSGTSGPSVRKIYEAIFGIQGSKIDSTTAIFPSGPPKVMPLRVIPNVSAK
ncbi:MAG: penicillin-binding transpeptidase domain-containing protein [Actinobacteria bacterium]|nr:penicillin-binding transpeptidase domain-containing protein [Actinomycetota bacterium]